MPDTIQPNSDNLHLPGFHQVVAKTEDEVEAKAARLIAVIGDTAKVWSRWSMSTGLRKKNGIEVARGFSHVITIVDTREAPADVVAARTEWPPQLGGEG